MASYYNEIDPYAAAWLRNLIAARLIPDGFVDERDVRQVKAGDLVGYTQCHFFAGIAGWPLALQLAGIGAAAPLWTGSCPCQPFSVAGRQLAEADRRHLWPEWRRLIAECRPAVIFGEQVASAAGRQWLAGVRADLEAMDYAVGAADLGAASIGAPHIRQRLWFVADADRERQSQRSQRDVRLDRGQAADQSSYGDDAGRHRLHMADAERRRQLQWIRRSGEGAGTDQARSSGNADRSGAPGAVGDAGSARLPLSQRQALLRAWRRQEGRAAPQSGGAFWRDGEWLLGRDGKARRVKPGIRLLAYGVPNRVAKLRALGNAVVPQLAAEFITAYCEARS